MACFLMKLESKFQIPSRIFGEKEIAEFRPLLCYVPLEVLHAKQPTISFLRIAFS